MIKNTYIFSEHLIQLCLCVNLIAFNMYPNVAIITLNGMMQICNCFGKNFAWELAIKLYAINEES